MLSHQLSLTQKLIRGIFKLLIWIILAPFKLLMLMFAEQQPEKYINADGYVVLTEFNELEHRYIAKQVMGRKLFPNEVVHHINGEKTDNAISNLCLMDKDKHEHFHSWLQWKRRKTKKYPSIDSQKRTLQTEYGGTLLESVKVSKSELITKVPVVESEPMVTPSLTHSASIEKRVENDLFELLRKERLALAKASGVPAYVVFHDVTLREIASVMPSTEEELRYINGVGLKKVELYGSQFLKIILSFKAELEEETA